MVGRQYCRLTRCPLQEFDSQRLKVEPASRPGRKKASIFPQTVGEKNKNKNEVASCLLLPWRYCLPLCRRRLKLSFQVTFSTRFRFDIAKAVSRLGFCRDLANRRLTFEQKSFSKVALLLETSIAELPKPSAGRQP